MTDSMIPIPPPAYSIVKALHYLGIPRDRLRFVVKWMCNHVPYAGRECSICGQVITKSHLEPCAVRSPLPIAEPGKGIDTLLFQAVTEMDTSSALLALKILTKEVIHAFPPL